MKYRVKWLLYRLDEPSKEAAREKVARMVKNNPIDLFSIEDDEESKSWLSMLLFG